MNNQCQAKLHWSIKRTMPKSKTEKCNNSKESITRRYTALEQSLQDIQTKLSKNKNAIHYLRNATFNQIAITFNDECKEKLFRDKIGKLEIKNTIDLLVLLSNNYLNNCKTYIESCHKLCSLLPQLKDLYNGTKEKMNKSKEISNTLNEA
ncbi:uncharacterized protein T551_00603 [Pneumocystis jirovecii RU7]|uniref:Uncharacterized protein n=1 Tax=Pneumocystis jirovecii (strain RU7) TaxID=1408657 RepID=A0A0W4ZVW4_PNEJ7|nr:uncharacterized protein T551_00603 [Pneumocystis jirovecii RU7]KTW32513.1 hypothetical protein T551_00603 [Pneumocystis jirovecii RU7]